MDTTLPSTPVRGSYEALLQEAQALAAKRDDAAVDIYQRLIDRLTRIPQAQRMTHSARLQNVLVQAGVNLQAYLNMFSRYDESLAVLDTLRANVDGEERDELALHAANVQLQAGRLDEGVATLRTLAGNEPDLEDLGSIAIAHLRHGQTDAAEAILHDMETISQSREVNLSAEARARDVAYLASLRSLLASERGEWDEAIARFELAAEHTEYYANNYNLLYTRLIHGGAYEQALPLTERDANRRIRSSFWRGVALHHLGRDDKARALWQQVTETELTEAEASNLFEVILSFYYLGDPERLGLELALRLISETRNPSSSVFLLLGLGWALRGHERNAHANFEMAMRQRRSMAEGAKLNRESWFFVEDLVDETLWGEFAGYFERG